MKKTEHDSRERSDARRGVGSRRASPGDHAQSLPPPRYGLSIVDARAPGEALMSIQRKATAAGTSDERSLPASGPGKAMPDGVRGKMEEAFGMDFSGVRVHEGPQAAALGALAYTQGTDIHFAPGQYQPFSQQGQKLIGHELTHVAQQAQGRVRATRQMKGVGLNDNPALEREADIMGGRAARGAVVTGGGGLGRLEGTGAHNAIQNYANNSERALQLKRTQDNYNAHRPPVLGAVIQRVAADDFEKASAGSNTALENFKKNAYWEIGFRKLSNVKPGTFDVDKENNSIITLTERDIGDGISMNHSIQGIAVSRNADFVLDVLRAGNQKVVVIVAVPPNFGVDLEAEYLKWYRKTQPDTDRQNKSFPIEYEQNLSSKLSMEITLQRVPAGCVYAWIERNNGNLTYIANPRRACPDIAEIDDQGRYAELISKVKALKEDGKVQELINFPS